MDLEITRTRGLRGEISVPGDKSISHRAAMLGALAGGTTEIGGFLPGADCLSTLDCLEALGVTVHGAGTTAVRIVGRGPQGLCEPEDNLDAGNSGTTMRLLLGILAGHNIYATITGDASLRRRPMGRVALPLREMGARILGRNNDTLAPLAIRGGSLQPIHYRTPVASAQLKSAVLLAGLFAEGTTSVTEPSRSRDHTERMLRYFGAPVREDGLTVAVDGLARLEGRNVQVPGDISSAAFFLVAASIVPGSQITITNVGVNPTRTGIIDALQAMGARIELENVREQSGEPVADLVVRYAPLKGTEIGGEIIPRLIDEIPVLAVAAAVAEGETVITGAAELRVKESDRLAALVTELGRMGAKISALPDGLIIQGDGGLTGAACSTYDDHRMAMAMAVAGLAAKGTTKILDAGCVSVSYPNFMDTLKSLQL
ncbi:MAG: 3-phosphoshikimate 1-carboxyvinyltransferase [Bacillota bacterium]